MDTKQLSKTSFDLIERYRNLDLGGKKVICPYYINNRKRKAELRSMIGKGLPEEIENETKIYSKIKGFDLYKLSSYEIRSFMIMLGIGIDCSGFVTHILNEHLKSIRKKNIVKYLKFENQSLKNKILRFIRPIENISANDLTSKNNCININNFDVRVADLIRFNILKKGFHVAIVTKVKYENQKAFEIEYANSTRWYNDLNGIRIGKIKFKNNGSLDKQIWEDEEDGRNFLEEEYLVNKDDSGFRRLKILYE